MSIAGSLGRIALLLLLLPTVGAVAARAQEDAAKTALDRGDYKSAEALTKKALIAQPRSPELLTELGMALQMQGRSTASIHVYEQALALKSLPRTYALLAEEKCRSRDLDGARPMLEKIVKDDAAEPLLLALVAPCLLELDEPVEAVTVYSALLGSDAFPHDLALIQLSKAYLLAAQFFFARLAATPGNATYEQAIKNARDQVSPDARGAFDDAEKSSPYFRADLSFTEAVRVWREHPDDPALLYLLSVLSSEASIRQIELCSEQYPDSPYFAQLKLEMLAEQGRESEAAEGYEALLRSHPELPDLQYALGMLYRKQRMWDKAEAVFRAQLARDPEDEQSAARLSEALEEQAKWTELRAFLAPRFSPSGTAHASAPLWASLDMAEAEENLGKPQEAIRVLVGVEKAEPSNKTVRFRLVRLYRQTGNMAQAQAESRWLQAAGAPAGP